MDWSTATLVTFSRIPSSTVTKFATSAPVYAEQLTPLVSIVAEALTRHQRPSVLLSAGAGRSTHGAVAMGHGNHRHALMSVKV